MYKNLTAQRCGVMIGAICSGTVKSSLPPPHGDCGMKHEGDVTLRFGVTT